MRQLDGREMVKIDKWFYMPKKPAESQTLLFDERLKKLEDEIDEIKNKAIDEIYRICKVGETK